MIKYGGILAATAAFILWGMLPAYWKLLQGVPAYEILCHRMSWSLLLTLGLLFLMRRQAVFRQAIKKRENLITYTASALLLAVNWLLYIWAVNAGFIVETSLGYYINPLINVFFGMIFFGEKIRPAQWVALLFAFFGVLYLTVYYGKFPWIALVLAVSFAIYALLHKKNSMAALDGLCMETGVLFIPGALFLCVLEFKGTGAFGQSDLSGILLLIGTGVVTTVPLLLFGYAAKNIPLSTLGFLQYIAPTIAFLLGIFVYEEEFPRERMVGFLLIWIALALYTVENMLNRFRYDKTAVA